MQKIKTIERNDRKQLRILPGLPAVLGSAMLLQFFYSETVLDAPMQTSAVPRDSAFGPICIRRSSVRPIKDGDRSVGRVPVCEGRSGGRQVEDRPYSPQPQCGRFG